MPIPVELSLKDKLTLKTIADYVRVNYRNRSASTGFLLSQSAGYKFNDLPFQCDISCVWFNTDDYNSRLTIYEKNVLYAFSMPSFYYEGTRLAINVRYELNKHIMVQAKYGMTHYLIGMLSVRRWRPLMEVQRVIFICS